MNLRAGDGGVQSADSAMVPASTNVPASGLMSRAGLGWMAAFARRRPFVALFGLIVLSNVTGTYFNFAYNNLLIVRGILNERQAEVF